MSDKIQQSIVSGKTPQIIIPNSEFPWRKSDTKLGAFPINKFDVNKTPEEQLTPEALVRVQAAVRFTHESVGNTGEMGNPVDDGNSDVVRSERSERS